MKGIVFLASIATSASLMATLPTITANSVTMTQDQSSRLVTISYMLADAASALGLQPWFEALSSANTRVDYLYNHRTGERSDREAAKGGDSTDSLRKTAAGLIANIIRRINVFNEVSPSEASRAAVNGVDGVIKQYKLVISSHAGKKEEPEPEPNPETAAQG